MKRPGRNDMVLLICLGVAAGMVGMSYAAVPLYYMFCAATGYGGTPQRADAAPGRQGERVVTVRFDANVSPALDWSFTPAQRAVEAKVGESKLAFFRAENTGREPIVGTATFNVTPEKAALYFVKVQCFCFTEQRLDPGESIDMPVTFFVDPAIDDDRSVDDVKAITLSYTFYPAAHPKTAARAGAPRIGS